MSDQMSYSSSAMVTSWSVPCFNYLEILAMASSSKSETRFIETHADGAGTVGCCKQLPVCH